MPCLVGWGIIFKEACRQRGSIPRMAVCGADVCPVSHRLSQIHHAIPRGRGGHKTSPHNLITLCQVCHMQAHGDNLKGMPFTQADVEQACVEYLADMYAPVWWPWRDGYDPGQGG